MDEIRESIKAKETNVNIDTILKQEKRMEEALDQSVKEFQEIHPEFFSKLNALSDNKLTPLDLRYCAYIHLKLSTKELATIFNVEPKKYPNDQIQNQTKTEFGQGKRPGRFFAKYCLGIENQSITK